MKCGYASQYDKPCIILTDRDHTTAADLIEECRNVGAVYYEDGPDDECFVVDFMRGVGPEIWTQRALSGSLK